MGRPLTAAVLLLAFCGGWGAVSLATAAQLPATPQLPSFGKGLFAPRSTERAPPARPGAEPPLPARPTLLRSPASTFEGREATLQVLQDCYVREAAKVRGGGAPDTRVRRLRLACENEEIADTRAWLRWSKIGDARQSRRIVNAIQQDAAERALSASTAQPAP